VPLRGLNLKGLALAYLLVYLCCAVQGLEGRWTGQIVPQSGQKENNQKMRKILLFTILQLGPSEFKEVIDFIKTTLHQEKFQFIFKFPKIIY
jgi:hypothetical protein